MSESKDYCVVAVLDHDDPYFTEYSKVSDNYPEVSVILGESNGKIHACNRANEFMPQDTDIICLHSDDMKFVEYGFDTEIREAFTKHFPDLDGVVHFPDGHQSNTMTYTMMGINLFKKLGYLYYPDYKSVFADNDLTELSQLMGKYAFVNKQILEHNHPIFGVTDWDSQYRANESAEYYQTDGETFKQRKLRNFDL